MSFIKVELHNFLSLALRLQAAQNISEWQTFGGLGTSALNLCSKLNRK